MGSEAYVQKGHRKSKKRPAIPKRRRGCAPSEGRSIDARDLPDDRSKSTPDSKPHVAPQGLPISVERYRAIKKRARTRSAPAVTSAQEDPSEDDGD
jgi:hypothetical protein